MVIDEGRLPEPGTLARVLAPGYMQHRYSDNYDDLKFLSMITNNNFNTITFQSTSLGAVPTTSQRPEARQEPTRPVRRPPCM